VGDDGRVGGYPDRCYSRSARVYFPHHRFRSLPPSFRAGRTTLRLLRASAAPQHRTVDRQHNAVLPFPILPRLKGSKGRHVTRGPSGSGSRACACTSETIVDHADRRFARGLALESSRLVRFATWKISRKVCAASAANRAKRIPVFEYLTRTRIIRRRVRSDLRAASRARKSALHVCARVRD